MRRQIALVDCNNFYASCERVFNPRWQERPVAVLSNNDGCVIARSEEVKQLGIAMGVAYHEVRERLRAAGAVVVSSNYPLYGDMSARVMRLLEEFAPQVEVYSIDESWLDLSGIAADQLAAYAGNMTREIRRMTGIPVSAGIAATKVLAKAANRYAKREKLRDGVCCLTDAGFCDRVLGELDVTDIWGVGRRWGERLRRRGIDTAKQLRDAEARWIRQHFGVVMERLVWELRGTHCHDFEDPQPKQQIIASRSFGRPVESREELGEALTFHVSRAAEKLRTQGSRAGYLSIFMHPYRFREWGSTYSGHGGLRLPMPSADTRVLVRAAMQCLDAVYRAGCTFAKAGVMLTELTADAGLQTQLFERGDRPVDDRLMAAVDRINRGHGRGTLFVAAQGTAQGWRMKQQFRTRAYTTRWEELASVR